MILPKTKIPREPKTNIPKESLRHRYQDIKRIRDTKGNFHAKMGTIKDRNGMDLLEETLNIYLGGMFLMKPVGNCISKSRTEHTV